MPWRLNLTNNGYMAPPNAYPIRLWAGGHLTAIAVLPSSFTTVTATVYADFSANFHIALYNMPTSNTGADGGLVQITKAGVTTTYQADLIGVTTTPQTISITAPDSSTDQPSTYIVKIWADSISGITLDSGQRQATGGSYKTSMNPALPGAAWISLIEVS